MTKNIEDMSSDNKSGKSNATNQFNNFMSKRRTGKGEPFTHTFFGGVQGRYFIRDEEYTEFLDLYEASVKEGKQEHFIVEYPKEVGPLCIDIDIDFEPDKKFEKRQYTQAHIKGIIKKMNSLLKKYTDIDESKIKAYVTEKPKPTVDFIKGTKEVKRYKDGFHIMYPKVSLKIEDRMMFIEMCENKVGTAKIFDDIDYKNEYSTVFDKRIVKSNGWMMYGSRKSDGQLYKITKVYNSDAKTIKIKPEGLEKMLSNRKYNEEDALEIVNKDDPFLIQILKKIKNPAKKTKKVKAEIHKIEEDSDEFESGNESGDDKNYNEEDIDKEENVQFVENKVSTKEREKIEKIVQILDSKRAYSYDTWSQVGWCLRNIDKRLLPAFKKFSKEHLAKYCKENPKVGKKKYDEESCVQLWNNARETGSKLTIKSLYHWARTDNYEKYMDICRTYFANDLIIASSGSHFDVANVLHKMYGHQYVCASIQKGKWYEFQNHRWVYIDGAYTLKKKMSTEFINELCKLQQHLYLEKDRNDAYIQNAEERLPRRDTADINTSLKDVIMQRSEKTLKLIEKLKNGPFKDFVLKECCLLFYDGEFEEKLDSDRDLLGFNNGVYDLRNGLFRAGTPEDYITFTVGYDYKVFNENDGYIKSIHEFFDKIQPEKDMKEYMLYLFASHLDGHIKKQRFPIFTGYGGSNGKSASLDLLSMVLGDYASSVPHTLLTRKRGSAGSATPELADKRGIRLIQINEPSKNDELDVGYLKELTGKDTIQARALYGDIFYFKPQFQFILICNKLPRVDANDGGTWRRIRAIPFEVQFIDHDRKIEIPGKQFYKDEDLDEKFELWKAPFMWLLLSKYYPVSRSGKTSEPDKVTQCTKDYKKDSDFFYEFLVEFYELTKNEKDKINIDDITADFRDYTKEEWVNSGQRPGKKDLLNYLESNGYKKSGSKISGLREKITDGLNGNLQGFD